jgi:hypothetical protein
MNVLERLVEARSEYGKAVSPAYDEVLWDVVHRVVETKSIGKADIGALLFWKRLRADTPWVARLHALADDEVRASTALAVDAVRDDRLALSEAARKGRRALAILPGFASGDALASALLLSAAPNRMAVYDRRAQRGLERLGLQLAVSPGRYGRYMELVETLVADVATMGKAWIPRDVDVALYWLGG